MKKRWKFLAAALAVAGGVWLNNSSPLTSPIPAGPLKILAHRGVHQTFPLDEVENDTCTAKLIRPPTHQFIENTIASMRAAFAAGADVVELDIHLTTDKKFAVFHDWTLDCRTNGRGVTEETPMAVLNTLDVGFGYTADGGKTFPLRGLGQGAMPTLDEVFEAMPDGRFLIDFKSNRAEEGEALAAMLKVNSAYRAAVFGVYGGGPPTRAALANLKGLKGYDRKSASGCLVRYGLLGWTGYVPDECRNTLVVVPVNYAHYFWGWPRLFEKRMAKAGSDVILLGPYGSGGFSSGLDTVLETESIPRGFTGLVWTNRIETIGPLLNAKDN